MQKYQDDLILLRYIHILMIMVAHRLSTVVDFDRIIVLRDGTIVEEGTYSDLMEQDGYFAELVRKQMA